MPIDRFTRKPTKSARPSGGRPGGPGGRPGGFGGPGGAGGQRFQGGQKFQGGNRPTGGNFKGGNAGGFTKPIQKRWLIKSIANLLFINTYLSFLLTLLFFLFLLFLKFILFEYLPKISILWFIIKSSWSNFL